MWGRAVCFKCNLRVKKLHDNCRPLLAQSAFKCVRRCFVQKWVTCKPWETSTNNESAFMNIFLRSLSELIITRSSRFHADAQMAVTWLNDGVCKAPSAPTGHSVYVRLQLCQGCRCSIPSPLNRHAKNLKNLTMAGLVCLHVKAHIWQSAPIQPAQCAQCAPHGEISWR